LRSTISVVGPLANNDVLVVGGVRLNIVF